MNLIISPQHNKIENFEQEELIAEFRENLKKYALEEASLDVLSLMGNSYSETFFDEISPYIYKLKEIKKIVLNDCFTNRKDDLCTSLEYFTKAIKNKGVIAFDISNNAIGANGCEAIFDFIKNCDTLQYFYANNCGLSQNAVPIQCQAFQEGKPPLKVLSMARNRIEIKAIDVAESLKCQPTLEEFVIYHNGINDQAMTPLLQAVTGLNNLKKLDISDNWVGEKALVELLKIIENNSVVSLNIGDCNIEEETNEIISESLEKAKTKKWEFFGHNYNELFDKKIRTKFVNALMEGGKLLKLSFKGNEIEEEEAESISNEMKKKSGSDDVEFEWDDEYIDEEEDDEFKKVIAQFELLAI